MAVTKPKTALFGKWLRGSMQVVDQSMTTGDVLFVDSGSSLASDVVGNGATPDKPYATLDYAVGQATANNGDRIYVAPGHAETLTGDAGVDVDTAGVSVIGLGNGEDRPIFTFTTAAAADFKMNAANTRLSGCVFKCNITSQAMMIEVSGDDVEIDNCEFREGTETGLNFITVGVADNDSDRCNIHDCIFFGTTAGNYSSAISFAKDHEGVAIEDNHIHGDFDLAGISVPTAGNLQINLRIRRNSITNLQAGGHAIEVTSTANTGVIEDNRLVTDVVSTSLDPGGLASSGNLWNVIGDALTEGVPPNPVSDQSTTLSGSTNDTTTDSLHGKLGTDTELNDNSLYDLLGGAGLKTDDLHSILMGSSGIATFPAAAAPADTVSMAEALREVYDQEEKVFTTAAAVIAAGTATVFTVAGGPIEVISLISVCVSGNDGTATLHKWTVNPTDGTATDISAASATLANATAGTILNITGTLANATVITAQGTAIAQAGGVVVPVGVITSITSGGATTGTWTHHLRYKPLGRGVVIT